jgi:hypothetical protein
VAHIEVPVNERRELARHGKALPDGSFPTGRVKGGKVMDSPILLRHAFQSYGRAKPGKRPAVRKYLVRRAVEMDRVDMIPKTWKIRRR